MDENWKHLQAIARKLTADYADAIFIGGIAVSAHAGRLGARFQEASHDADLYISLVGKAALRDRYEVRRDSNLGKDSAVIEGEDVDLYVEHQHPLGVPFDAIAAHAQDINGIRVAALEHLLVLKLDAAQDRMGSGKGEKDVRDVARIVALLEKPRKGVLSDYMTGERSKTLKKIMGRPDLPRLLGLNRHEGSRFGATLNAHTKAIQGLTRPGLNGFSL